MSLIEDLGLTPVRGGVGAWYTVKLSDDGRYRIDLLEMIYNWRIAVSAADDYTCWLRAWCYRGKDVLTFLTAVKAAQEWDGLADSEPKGYYKAVGR